MNKLHRVDDVSYQVAIPYTVCSCGERMEHEDPEKLAVIFQDHRSANGAKRRSLSESFSSESPWRKMSIK